MTPRESRLAGLLHTAPKLPQGFMDEMTREQQLEWLCSYADWWRVAMGAVWAAAPSAEPTHGPDCSAESCSCFERGLRAVTSIRCTAHIAVPAQNRNERNDAECGGCIAAERDALQALLREAYELVIRPVADAYVSHGERYKDLRDRVARVVDPLAPLSSIRGLCPGISGDMSSEAFIEKQREEDWPE